MSKSIYTYYKERLVEIGGGSKCIYLKGIAKRTSYDLGRIYEGRDAKVSKFVDFLWSASGRYPFTIISRDEKREILENIDIESRIASAQSTSKYSDSPHPQHHSRRDERSRTIDAEISHLQTLAREVEEIERETGRCELFVGYPFVFGAVKHSGKLLKIKAPLLLFPVKIEFNDSDTVEIRFNTKEKIHVNPALIYTYAQARKISIDNLELSFDNMENFRSVKDVIDYLDAGGIKIDFNSSKNIYTYTRFKEPEDKAELSVRFAAVLGRFPLSNSIYNDYTLLEKQKLTNAAIDELLKTGKKTRTPLFGFMKKKSKKLQKTTYTVKPLDFAQKEVVRKIDECGNIVIYGPPGTGKSQTIVNAIGDAIAKGKKILVVSQKKAALDVVYNRLGTLNEKCMYVTDETKEKGAFYERCLTSHLKTMGTHTVSEAELREKYSEIMSRIAEQTAKLEAISDTLNQKRPFGLSLSEMYTSSVMLNKKSNDYAIYQSLIENTDVMSLDYKTLSSALFSIKSRDIEKTYYDYMQAKEKNPIIAMTQISVDIHTISEVKGKLEAVQKSRKIPFDTERFPYFRQVLAHYNDLDNERVLESMVKLECKAKFPKKLFLGNIKKEIRQKFIDTIEAIENFSKDYSFLHLMFSDEGFISIIDNLVRGNNTYMKQVFEAINTYVAMRDVRTLLDSFDKTAIGILSFAYTVSKGYTGFVETVESILPLRIYHEVIYLEEICKDDLAKTVDYPNIKSRIIELSRQAEVLAASITSLSGTHEYAEFYGKSSNNKDYLYQISKKQKFWPIRKTMEVYGDFLLNLFPCWLLSPENVSSLLPLKKNMFDLVIFDEASQVFIESTIPTIFRGKNIIVAGDSKQLRPSSAFMRRYIGQDPENEEDFAKQAALEVESLLDLAVARYESANLTYHYRSKKSELIDFSNSAFYRSSLIVAPNISKNTKCRPIERIKLDGQWQERKNEVEAEGVVKLLKKIFKTGKNGETIGIITFNSEQQACIADKIDRECAKDVDFRTRISAERQRIENGEDVSLFIKNLENVQGDERDIIIFSVGYAKNSEGKVHTGFGSLSAEGGENRLNVAITRARSKIYVITSIEPEELKVDDAKNCGPKLLKKYLEYVRAVSNGNNGEISILLDTLNPKSSNDCGVMSKRDIAASMKERLEKLGYEVDVSIGNAESRISLAIYDKDEDRYLVGVELDSDAYLSSSSTIERDVFKPEFLESRGWHILRIWCREYWLSPSKVIKTLASVIEACKSKK